MTKSQRKIKKTWKVQLKKNSEIHSAGLVLPSGDSKEFDPFLIMAEDKFQKNAFDTYPQTSTAVRDIAASPRSLC